MVFLHHTSIFSPFYPIDETFSILPLKIHKHDNFFFALVLNSFNFLSIPENEK
jgi:hypothetical protein